MDILEQLGLLQTDQSRRPSTPFEAVEDAAATARLKCADRSQLSFARSFDEVLPGDHVARSIWKIVEHLDLSALYKRIRSRQGNAGAPAIDPKITLALWVLATSEGEGSAREIAELCRRHDAYRWMCGGVSVRAHHLSDFRSENGKVFSSLITQVVSVCLKHGLCDLSRVAQDGTRVRASAGAASFRRGQTLEELRGLAQEHLDEVLRDAGNQEHTAVRRAARERGARDVLARIDAAIAELPQVAELKAKRKSEEEPRVSTTDEKARVMRMPDNGFRPAYNVQLAATVDRARLIVGVDVSNSGSDTGLATPMMEQIEDRFGQRPTELLADSAYASHDEIDALHIEGTTLVAPFKKQRKGTRPPTEARDTDSPAVADWRARMQTDDAKAALRLRGATIECVNADGKQHRGLDTAPIRGPAKVLGWATLFALTYNILRVISLVGQA